MNTIITYDINNLQTISVYDGTTFEAPDSITDIKGVRILFQTVNSVNEVQQAETCLANFEYEVLSGTAVVNGISYPSGSVMLFTNDTTPTGTYTMQTTGRYGQYISDNLPSSGNAWEFSPSQTGREAYNTSFFNDEVFTMTYEFYDEVFNAGDTLDAGTYLVVSYTDSGANAVVDSTKVVYVGEIYESLGAETFASSPDVIFVKFKESSEYSFSTLYLSFGIYQRYLSAKSVAVAPNWLLDSNLLAVLSLMASQNVAAETESGIDLQLLQDNIDRIINYYNVQI